MNEINKYWDQHEKEFTPATYYEFYENVFGYNEGFQHIALWSPDRIKTLSLGINNPLSDDRASLVFAIKLMLKFHGHTGDLFNMSVGAVFTVAGAAAVGNPIRQQFRPYSRPGYKLAPDVSVPFFRSVQNWSLFVDWQFFKYFFCRRTRLSTISKLEFLMILGILSAESCHFGVKSISFIK